MIQNVHQKLLSFSFLWLRDVNVRGCIQKFPELVDNEINNSSNEHTLRSNTKSYGVKTH
jgi:hypothetical protein